jgi:hypothetical protein
MECRMKQELKRLVYAILAGEKPIVALAAGVAGAEQNVDELLRRLTTQAALAEQVSAEVGDLTSYVRRRFAEANRAEILRNK